jgi:hypothetical protein
MKPIPRRTVQNLKRLEDMILYLNRFQNTSLLNIIEIGCWVGVSTELFSKYFKNVLAVDPFEQTDTEVTSRFDMRRIEQEFNKVYNKRANIIKVKKRSVDYAKMYEQKQWAADVIYIDGSHKYDAVKTDILAWKDKIKYFICGHDYCQRFHGVKKAVDEILGRPDRIFADTSWVKRVG